MGPRPIPSVNADTDAVPNAQFEYSLIRVVSRLLKFTLINKAKMTNDFDLFNRSIRSIDLYVWVGDNS